MKSTTIKILALLLIIASASATAAQSVEKESASDESEAVKKTLLELFELSKSERYSEIAPFLVYRGEDEKRRDLDVCDFNNAEERRNVEGAATEIKKLIWLSDAYKLSEYTEEVRSKRRIYIWRVTFKGGANEGTVTFSFIKIKQRYAILNIAGQMEYLRRLMSGAALHKNSKKGKTNFSLSKAARSADKPLTGRARRSGNKLKFVLLSSLFVQSRVEPVL